MMENEGQWGIGYTLMALGMTRRLRSSSQIALGYLQQSVALFRENDDQWGLALALIGVSSVSRLAGDLAGARTALTEGQALWRALGDPWGTAFHVHDAFTQTVAEKDEATATALYEEHSPSFAALGYIRPLAYMRHGLGELAVQRGAYAESEEHFRQSLELAREIGNLTVEASSLAGLALAALGQVRLQDAAALSQEALAHLDRLQRPNLATRFLQTLGGIFKQFDSFPLSSPLEKHHLTVLQNLLETTGKMKE